MDTCPPPIIDLCMALNRLCNVMSMLIKFFVEIEIYSKPRKHDKLLSKSDVIIQRAFESQLASIIFEYIFLSLFLSRFSLMYHGHYNSDSDLE